LSSSGTIFPFAIVRERLRNPRKSGRYSPGTFENIRLRSPKIVCLWGYQWGNIPPHCPNCATFGTPDGNEMQRNQGIKAAQAELPQGRQQRALC
jgi:hypothetical protein